MEREFEFNPNDIVKHFKFNLLNEEDKKANKFLYRIIGEAMHTETEETLIVYQALYAPYQLFARPKEMFNGLVDKEKYPNCEQIYRFEKVKESGDCDDK